MTPNKERPGLSPEPTCLCMGRLIPNGLPMGTKAKMRQLVDLTNEAQHGGTREVSLEHVEYKSAVDCSGMVCSYYYYYSSL